VSYVDWGWHVQRLTRWDAKVIQEQLDRPISSRLDMHGHGTLRPSGNHPVGPDFKSELRYVDGQIARVPYVDSDSCFLNSVLILSDAWKALFIGLREPNTDPIHLRTIRVPAVSEEDHEGKQQGACTEPGRYVPQIHMRHDQ
jgi:hypothetical protein